MQGGCHVHHALQSCDRCQLIRQQYNRRQIGEQIFLIL